MKCWGILIGIALLVTSAASSRAEDVLFTLTATSNEAQLGYTLNQSVTFVFLVNDDFSSDESAFQSDANTWISDVSTVVPLFESISGTGLTGTYDPTPDPYAWILNDTSGILSIYANTDVSGASIGLSTPDSTAVKMIDILIWEAANWAFPNTATTPGAYFPPFEGSLNIGDDSVMIIKSVGSTTAYEFTITSASISIVPEPSTWALLGLGGVVLVHVLRRRTLQA